MEPPAGNIVQRMGTINGKRILFSLVLAFSGPRFKASLKWRSFQLKTEFHCTHPFNITSPSS